MRLADLRKLAIRKQSRIRFPLRNGMECVVTEHGVAQVPGLAHIPDFNLEEELGVAPEFVIEAAAGKERGQQRASREEMAAMSSTPNAAGAVREDE